MILYYIIAKLVYKYQRGPIIQYDQLTNTLKNKIVIITGASAGIGKETAKKLAQYDATIIFACRNEQKTLKVIYELNQETGNYNLYYMNLILEDYDNIISFTNKFKQQFKSLDILINNAGIAQWWHQFNKYNHELVFATNYLGHFLLTYQLQNILTQNSRIIFVSSVMHEMIRKKINFQQVLEGKYLENYNITKYCLILACLKFSQLLKQKTKVVALHPGVIKTELLDKAGNTIILQMIQKLLFWIFRPMTLSLADGASTTIYCALMPFKQLVNEGYYEKNRLSKYSNSISKLNQIEELWQFSCELLKEFI